ncbi:MAG: GTP-binding protein [Merdibacter sp.]
MTASETQSGTRARETQIALGLLAHVDAGKTTLSEGLLYLSGAIRKRAGSIGDSALDYDRQEQARGITIYAKRTSRITATGTRCWIRRAMWIFRRDGTDAVGAGLCTGGHQRTGWRTGPYPDHLAAAGSLSHPHVHLCQQDGHRT